MLDKIQEKLGALVSSTWKDDVAQQGQLVALYREYVYGNQRVPLTPTMKSMLRISDNRTDHFTINYCDTIVQMMTDRLKVTSIDGNEDSASEWAADVLEFNRFDGLQMDVHESAVRDGVTYLMGGYDNVNQQPIFAQEDAYDGDVGLIAIYDRTRKHIVAAVKIWAEGDLRRVNIYFEDRIEKYSAGTVETPASDLTPLEGSPEAWSKNGVGLGVPVVAVKNRGLSKQVNGISEVAIAIPLQDALNRTLVSMIMTSELTAFQIRVAIGFNPPANVTPGMWVVIGGEEGLSKTSEGEPIVDAKVLESGQIVPFISQAQFLIEQIATATRTPLPGMMGGDSQSGEALKQRESGLLGKIERFQVKAGNAWEDVLSMSARIHDAFGTKKAPAVARWMTKWESPEVRSDAETVANAWLVRDAIGQRELLRQLAKVFDWDANKIDALVQEVEAEQASRLAAMGGSLPGFGQFNLPDNQFNVELESL